MRQRSHKPSAMTDIEESSLPYKDEPEEKEAEIEMTDAEVGVPLIQSGDDYSKSKVRLPHKSYRGRQRTIIASISSLLAVVLIGE